MLYYSSVHVSLHWDKIDNATGNWSSMKSRKVYLLVCGKLLNIKELTERSIRFKTTLFLAFPSIGEHWSMKTFVWVSVSVSIYACVWFVCVCVGHIRVVLCIKNTSQQAFHIPQGKNKGYSESRSQPARRSTALPCLKDTDKEKRRFWRSQEPSCIYGHGGGLQRCIK